MKLSTDNTGAIHTLLDLAPKTARLPADGSDERHVKRIKTDAPIGSVPQFCAATWRHGAPA
jgi:hypothetical protein